MKLFKHKHKWKSIITGDMISEGVDEFYKCKCGARKIKYMWNEEYIIKDEKLEEEKYEKIIWDSIIYLFLNKKRLAKKMSERISDEWGSKSFRFGTTLKEPNIYNSDGYIIDFKISE